MTIRVFSGTATFVAVFAVATAIFTMIWGAFVTDRLYNCTDAVGLDYLQPGNWVHGEVAYVKDVRAGRSMSEPDTIKEGWSRAGLWALWLSFFGCSLVVGAFAAQCVSALTRMAENATPNGGPATGLGDSGVGGGPPSGTGSFAMKTVLFSARLLLGTMCLGCHAQTDDLQRAVASFPRIWARVYDPAVGARCANVLIQAGEERACAALLRAMENRRRDYGEWDLVNMQVCHLSRLLFTSRNSNQPLRRPMLGAIQGVPAESISRDPPEWPDLPFVVVDGIPLSLIEGYAGSGVPELTGKYIEYCRANGRFRTKLFAIPTTITASNALVSVFASPAWKSLSGKDERWSFYGNENEAKKSLWAQINNVANPTAQRAGASPPRDVTNTAPSAAGSRR